MSNKADLLKRSLFKFYKNSGNLDKLVKVLEKKTNYSLRVIEWFCNNYSKKNNIIYKLDNGTEFNVYLSYKSQLNSYQKKQFDPFKRDHEGFEKFTLDYGKKSIITTVGQLNFFKWCILNKILDYIDDNLYDIKQDMGKYAKYNKKQTDKRKKRQALSLSATRVCVKRYTNAILEFN